MEHIPLIYLSLGIMTVACGATLVIIGMTRIIARKVIGEMKNEAFRK